jgi:hypothetical protein
VKLILNILLALLLGQSPLYSQYEYFNNAYDTNGHSELCSNVIVEQDGYMVFGMRMDNGSAKLHLRTTDLNGENSVFDGLSIDGYSLFFINYAESFIQTSDGGYAWGGEGIGVESAGICAKFKSDFSEIEWSNEYLLVDSISYKEFHLAYELSSSDLIFAGYQNFDTDDDQWYEYSDLFLVKTDSEGNVLWEKNIELYDDQFLRVNQLFELDNGDLLVFGSVYHDWDQVICRISADGDSLLWKYRWGAEDLNDWLPWGVQKDNENFIVRYLQGFEVSPLSSDGSRSKVRMMEFSVEDQEVIWESEFDHIFEWGFIKDLVKTPDGGYAVLGWGIETPVTHWYGWVLKTDSLGNEEWFNTYYHTNPNEGDTWINDQLFDLEVTIDGGFIAVGQHLDHNIPEEPQQTWLLKLDACGEVEWQGCEPIVGTKEIDQNVSVMRAYPNPASEFLQLEWTDEKVAEIRLFDTLGNLVLSESTAGKNRMQFPVHSLASGV